MSTQRISSNATLGLNIFLPVFWTVFFGALTIALFAYDGQGGGLSFRTIKWVMLGIYLSGLAILYFTLFQLKRVELDDEYLYVTNYFKTYRYPFSSIRKTETSQFLFLALGIIHLTAKGKFGRRITFILANQLFKEFTLDNPQVLQQLKVNQEKL